MENEGLTRVQKIKRHFQRNKKTYLACGGTAVVTALATVLIVNRRPELVGMKQEINQTLSWRPVANNSIDVYVEALGDPGNIIQDTTTGTIYASQGQAARELGLDPSAISKQLNGRSPHVEGHTFTKLGKAMVAE